MVDNRLVHPDSPGTVGHDRWQDFQRDGFAYLSLLAGTEVDDLRDAVAQFGPDAEGSFLASPAHAWGDRARDFHLRALAIVKDRLAQGFPGYRAFMVAATLKGQGGGQVQFHQDWTFTDERTVRPIFLWLPLVEVSERNGALRLVPGSHRCAPETIRPSRGMESAQVTEPHQDVFDRLALCRPQVPGDALMFDPAVLHGSGPNLSDSLRPAVTAALVPIGTQLVHFHETPSGQLTGYRVNDDFFVTHDYGTMPDMEPDVSPWWRAIAEHDFDALGEGETATDVTPAVTLDRM